MTNHLDHIAQLEARIDALEARNAFQDDVIEQLNHELAVHQKDIAELKEHMKLIAQRIKSNSNSSIMARPEDEPPPPHY
ncbi:SlyX family protein [Thalassotalea sp. LPB0316]|uniref:SlyX family protein n=1 Tax=Thalassotalea sp. LPB0316 TaxID=2769490 RepID=UPI0018669F9B|nr:SlyX family protein [Thalassotalea sp. LPB0316]QOL26608.1 SlyX family protein [Thalassotalea sp. LPB0316]